MAEENKNPQDNAETPKPPESSSPNVGENGGKAPPGGNATGAPAGSAGGTQPLNHTPNGYVPGEEKKGLAEVARIIKERRLLRKDLKEKGIKSRKDFKIIAESLGLVLWKINPFFTWLHHALGAVAAGMGLKFLLGATAAALATTFLVSTITEAKGSFTINLTGDMLNAGYVLSETMDFADSKSRLFADALDEVNNITMEDIEVDVHTKDGAHNGNHYFAYTFYIMNRGEEASSYAWFFKLKDESLSVSDAVWIMLFEDDKQIIYARPQEDGSPEELFGFEDPLPFSDLAYNSGQYYQEYEDGVPLYGVITTPYANEDTVAQGLIENVQPGEYHKYTVVLWVEGYDPECTDDIFGGYARFEMEFERVDDNNKGGLFDGVFRTEYEPVPLPPNDETDTGEGE